MSANKSTFYQFGGIINALCILISGIYGFVDIGYNRNNYLTNVIVNLSCVLFSFLFIYYELNCDPNIESYFNKCILFLFTGLLVLGTSEVGFILGFIIILYSLVNGSFYYIEYKKPGLNNNTSENNNLPPDFNFQREESPPNPYRMNIPVSNNEPQNNNQHNYDVNTVNRNGNIIHYGSNV